MIKIQINRKKNLELDLIPLINIVFLLLIFFMLTSNSMSSSLKADLPNAQSSSTIKKKNIVLKISIAGLIELNGKIVQQSDLHDLLRVVLNQAKAKVVEIHGDKNIEFELFGEIIGEARRAGAEDFIFATKRVISMD